MALTASLNELSVSVHPGAEASCEVTVRNSSMVVDRVVVDILGDARAWSTIQPPELNLLPSTEGSVRITFRPPRSSGVPAGDMPFAIRAASMEDPESSVIEEGALRVGAFTDIKAEMVPKTSNGRRVGKHRLTVENRGNQPASISVTGADPDDALEFVCKPEVFEARPGTATFVTVRAMPRKRFLKGPNKTNPFQVFVLHEDSAPIVVDGVMLQRQTMPRWLLPALAILVLLAAGLIALYFLLFKPAVHSAATDAVNAQSQQLSSNAAVASKAAVHASQAANNANSAAAAAGAGGSDAKESDAAKTSGTAVAGHGGVGSGRPVSALMTSNVAPGATGTYSYAFPARLGTLSMSDIVLENPAGDTGSLKINAGSSTLFEFSLADFRNVDYHFVQALVFTKKNPLTLVVGCKNPGLTACTAGLSFSAQLSK